MMQFDIIILLFLCVITCNALCKNGYYSSEILTTHINQLIASEDKAFSGKGKTITTSVDDYNVCSRGKCTWAINNECLNPNNTVTD